MPTRRQLLIAPVPLLAVQLLHAQPAPWPNQPLRIVVPLPAGGAPDAAARAVAMSMSASLGQPVVVDNRPGASTTIGSEHVARSAPDGYTMLLTATGAPALFPTIMKLRYDPAKDFSPLGMVTRSEPLIVAASNRKMTTMADFIAHAKANPQKASIGSIGIGTTNHLLCERIKRAAGVNAIYVPFQGAPTALQALVSGDVDVLCLDVGGAISLIGGGRIVALAVASAERSSFLPDTPTLIEAGMPGVSSNNNFGLFLPAGVSPEVTAKLAAAVVKAVNSPETQRVFRGLGLIAQSSTPEELNRLIQQDAAVLVPLAKDLNIRLD